MLSKGNTDHNLLPEESTATPIWHGYILKKYRDEPEVLRMLDAIPTARARDFAEHMVWLIDVGNLSEAQAEEALAVMSR